MQKGDLADTVVVFGMWDVKASINKSVSTILA